MKYERTVAQFNIIPYILRILASLRFPKKRVITSFTRGLLGRKLDVICRLLMIKLTNAPKENYID